MMNKPLFLIPLLSLTLASFSTFAELDKKTEAALDSAIQGEHRTAEAKARDKYRKPKEVLEFMDFRSDMTVVEIWPGGGWYADILGPALQKEGKYYAAQYSVNGPYGYQRRGLGSFFTKLGKHHKLFKDVEVTELDLPYSLEIAPKESADMVLTFRNVHNLVMNIYGGGKYAELSFQAIYDALKPGGVLGIVDHQWDDVENEDPLAANGYISKERTIKLAESAGFKLVDSSEILRNPKDTKNYKYGVWSLPPTLAQGDEDKEKLSEIGESDRFLLKFEKPVKQE